ncbi:hypothetical protein [Ktedonospora formicarum]|uniref:Uncharacterized protein n=1 Tax=Ktedonospora formicarum TaxID=2778364 RepID=A0A8J3HYK3_9CHLR|nr:hypothetical protein [Ktedonospora formicarum]GHO42888.1 hypothetical protein KSX_10510 [Ktedonospora formicarum]
MVSSVAEHMGLDKEPAHIGEVDQEPAHIEEVGQEAAHTVVLVLAHIGWGLSLPRYMAWDWRSEDRLARLG